MTSISYISFDVKHPVDSQQKNIIYYIFSKWDTKLSMCFERVFGFEFVVAKKAEKRRVDFEMALRQMRHQLSATIQRKRLGTKVTRGHLLETLTPVEHRTGQASTVE